MQNKSAVLFPRAASNLGNGDRYNGFVLVLFASLSTSRSVPDKALATLDFFFLSLSLCVVLFLRRPTPRWKALKSVVCICLVAFWESVFLVGIMAPPLPRSVASFRGEDVYGCSDDG